MSMFTGLTSQITGLMNKAKGGEAGAEEGAVDPQQQAQMVEENGGEEMEGGEQAQGAGGVSGLAQGLMMKAMSAKDGLKEKASTFQPPNLQGLGGSLMQNVTNLIPGRKEDDVPTPPELNPPSEMGGEMVEGEEMVLE